MKKIPLYVYLSQSIVALSEVVMIYSLKFAIDSMVKKDLRTLIFVVLLIFGIVCIVQSYRVFNIYLIEKFMYQKNISIRNIFVKNIFCLKPQRFFKFSVGDYISLFTNKIERLETDVLRTKIRQSYDISAFLYTIVAVTWLSWQFTIMYLLIGVLLYLAPKLFGSKLSDKQKALNDSNEAYISELKASLDGYETIYGGNNNQYFINRLNSRNKEYQHSKYDYNYFAEFQQTFLVTLGIFTQVASYLLGGILIISGGITFGSFITLTNLGNSTYGPLAWIAQKFSIIKSFNVVYDQMGTYYKESEELQKDEVEDIVVEDLSVSYGDETVLEKESIHFEKGKKYLLHGSSGCGKSTLLKAIAGFLESYEGKIIFDNQQFENPDIQIIPQKSNFFEGTIKENILVGRDYDEKKFESIIKLLFIDEFYNDTKKLSFDGFGYSGGQLQRIAIARALYSEPKILIFDEASTGIQKEMADKIIASIVKMDMLFINVSHQYNDDKIALYDDVIDFDQRKNKC